MNGPSPSPSQSPSQIWPAFNLTAAAALVTLVDLSWGRTAARLLLPHNALAANTNLVLMNLGAFVSQLVGVLALLLLVMGLVSANNRRCLFPRTLTISLIFIAAVFVLLSGRAMVGPVGGRALLYIKVAYGFLSLFALVGLWRGSTPLRLSFGITLFALPGILAALASFIDRAISTAGAVASSTNRAGEWVALVAGLSAAALLAPRRKDLSKPVWFAAAAAACVVAIALVFSGLLLRFELLQTLAAHAFNLEVPPWTASGSGAYMVVLSLATGSVVLTVVSFAGADGALRLMGYGVVLMLASGYHPTNPGLLASSLVGLFAMALGASKSNAPADRSLSPS